MKRKLNFKRICFGVATLLMTTMMYAQNNVIDEVVWVVGDQAIMKSEVEKARLEALSEGRRFTKDPYCVIPEEIAIKKLFLHQAALDSIPVSDNEVIKRAEMMLSQAINDIGSKEKLEEYFHQNINQIRESLRERAREGLLVQGMQQKLVGNVKITPAEVRNYFKNLPKDSIPYIPTQVEVEIITREPVIPQSEIDDVKSRLREFTDRINKGDISFSTLARIYSDDKGSAMNGGELPFMGRGQLDQAFANVAFNLQNPGAISKIVESEFGYHIIQLIEKRGDRIKVRHILLKPHIPQEALNKAEQYLDSLGNQIRNGKYTFEVAAEAYSHDKDTRNNHGLLPNYRPDLGKQTSKFEMQELPPEIARVVDKMKVGEISDAFIMIPRKTGKEVCAIVKLKSRIDGHKATISDDYTNLKDIVLERKREKILNDWIKEKQKHTYVKIMNGWQHNCEFKYPGWGEN